MTSSDCAPYIRRLHVITARSLATAADMCQLNGNLNIEIEHWLMAMVGRDEGDVPFILRHYGMDTGAVERSLLRAVDRFPHGLRGRPGLSPRLRVWLEAAWRRVSPDGQDIARPIRSGHMLAALIDQPAWLRTPELSELLTMSADQIEQLMPELNKSKEAPSWRSDSECLAWAKLIDRDDSDTRLETASQETTFADLPDETGEQHMLQRFTSDITEKARHGQLDPVFGRDLEIRQVIDVLLRQRKNNPILVGDPGVGKTALVEGLALKIVEGNVPAALRDVKVLALDLGLMQAGAGVKGEFEQRLKGVVEAVQKSPESILLFVDEAHTLIGAGNIQGGTDAANLLKPALARGALRTIAATTWSEYKQYFERDAALERRFQMVKVDEPDDDAACHMLRGLKARLAEHHGVHITDAAVRAAVKWSRRYLSGRQLPDKAVDLLDTAAARVRMSMNTTPSALAACQAEQDALEMEWQALTRDHSATVVHTERRLAAIEARLGALEAERRELGDRHKEQRHMVNRLLSLREAWSAATPSDERGAIAAAINELHSALVLQGANLLVHAEVDETVVARVIADWTGVPIGSLLQDEAATLLNLEARLHSTVRGQDEALAVLAKSLRVAKTVLTSEHAPLGVFLLVGPSGVGKTETARALAEILFGGERSLITLNLSEYKEAHTISQLKGAPPGYAGYGQVGVLTEAIRQRPYSVILLDEVEKAHQDVINLFHQVFDRGYLRDGEGRLIDFRHSLILMTSNIGSDQIMAAIERGCQSDAEVTMDTLMQAIHPRLTAYFQPALLARFQTIVYRPLSSDALASIARLKLGKVAERIHRRFNASLQWEESLVQGMVRACQPLESGARAIDHLLEQQILPAVSQHLLARSTGLEVAEDIRLGYSDEEGVLIDVAVNGGA